MTAKELLELYKVFQEETKAKLEKMGLKDTTDRMALTAVLLSDTDKLSNFMAWLDDKVSEA